MEYLDYITDTRRIADPIIRSVLAQELNGIRWMIRYAREHYSPENIESGIADIRRRADALREAFIKLDQRMTEVKRGKAAAAAERRRVRKFQQMISAYSASGRTEVTLAELRQQVRR
jgi:acyl carrier protein phosphodiesterase